MQGRGEIDAARVEFLKLDAKHGITLTARKGTAPPTTVKSAIRSTAMAGAITAPTATREGDGHCYLLDTKAMQCRRSVLPPLLSPPQNSSRRNQYKITKSTAKKIFDPLEGTFALLGQKSLKKGQKIKLFGNL